ncbi:putative immunoglobulin-blocking virulence protein [Mycoplasma sp. T363T]|uniref:putative immunoglobulin-blocking virulence protein n=1 Tax=Mycoplasma bradburyae TaxID=2963128 RepID=UPI0023403E36|nr:putative immunoglobulin-blocking virulence protein [Mycoplasma bradburyae]MDC4163196.1 putative immunoglobulin-blocking virulence protein [Mycoplasma bradburyae]
MLHSKKRKIIKLIGLSSSSLVLGASATIGIVLSTHNVESKSDLLKRNGEVKLENESEGTSDLQNSNRDFNLKKTPKKPEKPDNRPVLENPKPEEMVPPEPQDDQGNELAEDTPIKYIEFNDNEDYQLDEKTPKQPNDPSVATVSEERAREIFVTTKKKLNDTKEVLLRAVAKGGNTTANRDALFNVLGYHNKDLFDSWWERLFEDPAPGRQRGIDDLLTSINVTSDSFIMSEAKANRRWELLVGAGNTTITFSYEHEEDNPVKNYMKKVNGYRVLGNPNKWAVDNPDEILSGDFAGWNKSLATDEYITGNYGFNADDGIEVRRYTPKDKNDAYYKDKEDLDVFVLDVDKTSGYNKFINVLKNVAERKPNKGIGVVLRNVGKTHTTRNVYNIIKALPNTVQTLTVFLEGANTTSLLALEGRHLRELNIYTTGQAITNQWGINPLAIKNINFIPSLLGYNVGGFNPYPPGATVASTPIFTTLKFDRNDDYARVQEGLKIAKDRRSERIFQGDFQGDGAKPIFWDFADAPIIRNLKNLNVYDAELRYVRLSADLIDTDPKSGSTYVTYDLDEFNHSQWRVAIRYRPENYKRYISFGRGTEVQQPKALILRGSEKTLEKEGLEELLAFVKYASNSNAFKEAYVSSNYIARRIKEAVESQMNEISVKVKTVEELSKFKIKTFKVDNTLNAIGDPLNSPTNNN